MSKYGEIRNDFYDDQEQKVYIDAWFTEDDNEEGTVIAKVNYKTKEVEYLDADARMDDYAQEKINETLSEIDNSDYENCYMFTHEELFILSSGLLQLINNVSKAKQLVFEEKSQMALDEELKMYQELNSKLMELCK